MGLQVFVNNQLVTSTTDYRVHSTQRIRDANVYIGRPNRVTSGRYGDFTIDELEVWYANVDHLKAFDLIDKGNRAGVSGKKVFTFMHITLE